MVKRMSKRIRSKGYKKKHLKSRHKKKTKKKRKSSTKKLNETTRQLEDYKEYLVDLLDEQQWKWKH